MDKWSVTYCLFMFCWSAADMVSPCNEGYATAISGQMITSRGGVKISATRSVLECLVQCVLDDECVQLYYDRVKETCSLVDSTDSQLLISSLKGLFISKPKYAVSGSQKCGIRNCPPPSVCINDCSLTTKERICVVEGLSCGYDPEVIQTKQYYNVMYQDDADSGDVQVIFFNKTRSDTAIRVQWHATTRGHYATAGTCSRYYVTFNNYECITPNAIDFIDYGGVVVNQQRMADIDGLCYNLPAGLTRVAIRLGPCSGYPMGDSYTGWKASRSTTIWETLEPSQDARISLSQCSALPIFNIRYVTIRNLNSYADPDSEIMTMSYTKIASDSVLEVKWLAEARVFVPADASYCARWYVTVDGKECTPKAEFILGLYDNAFRFSNNNHKTRTLEGFCYGIQIGAHVISVRVGVCRNVTAHPDTHTGHFNSISRFIVSEVRMATQVQAVKVGDERIIKVPFFNLRHWNWYLINNVISNGPVVVVTYSKLSDSSPIHVRAAGDMKVLQNCCRWFFTIDDLECQSPGPIEGVSYSDSPVSYHQPGIVDGVCSGYASGNYTIALRVGSCPGLTAKDCGTGWDSTLHVTVSELQLDASVNCSTPFSCF